MNGRRFWFAIGGAAVVGVIARIVYVVFVVRGNIELVGDAKTFHELGRLLADGEGYVRPREFIETGRSVATAEFPPAYPAGLAMLDVVGLGSPTAQRLAGALLGGVTVLIVGMLGRAAFDPTVGVVAAWITALYPQLIVHDGSLMSEVLYVPLVALALLGVYESKRSADDAKRRRWWLVAAVAGGLAVMTRTEAVLLVAMLVVPAAVVSGDRPATLRRLATGLSASVMLVGVWTIRNAISLGRAQPFTNNSATLIAGANCDATYAGTQIGGWRYDCIPDRFQQPLTVDESTWASDLRSVGTEYIGDHLADLPAVIMVRVLRTFGWWDVRTSLFLESLEGRNYDWLWAGWYVWMVLAVGSVVGVVVARRVGRPVWPLLVPIGVVALTSMISYGNQRFRAGAEPSVIVLASIAAVHLLRRRPATRRTS